MNHRPFEDWLLEGQPLTPEQNREMQSHLRDCPACAAIAEVDLALKSARMAAPAEGFTTRFQVRLERQRRLQRRRAWIGGSLMLLGALILLLWTSAPWLPTLLFAPVDLLASLIAFGAFLFVWLQTLLLAAVAMLRAVPGFVPPFFWAVLISAVAGMALLWSISIWRFVKFPRGV